MHARNSAKGFNTSCPAAALFCIFLSVAFRAKLLPPPSKCETWAYWHGRRSAGKRWHTSWQFDVEYWQTLSGSFQKSLKAPTGGGGKAFHLQRDSCVDVCLQISPIQPTGSVFVSAFPVLVWLYLYLLFLSVSKESICHVWPITEITGEPVFRQVLRTSLLLKIVFFLAEFCKAMESLMDYFS